MMRIIKTPHKIFHLKKMNIQKRRRRRRRKVTFKLDGLIKTDLSIDRLIIDINRLYSYMYKDI